MKIIGVILVIMASALIIVPQFFSCEAFGKGIVMPDGRVIPMKCKWTARAEIALGVLLLATGALLFSSKQKETRRFLSILGILLGVFAFLLPSHLIGVCLKPDMPCVVIMRPSIYLISGITIIASGLSIAVNYLPKRL
jgi:hypothetical protein